MGRLITSNSVSGVLVVTFVALLATAGCESQAGKLGAFDILFRPVTRGVPDPINLMLPQSIRIHPFTGTRDFDATQGVRGLEVRIEALDAYQDSAKAFGVFRFELYKHREENPDGKGERISSWEVDLMGPQDNVIHWDKVHRNYLFKLKWDKPIPIGTRFMLSAVFESPYTERLFDEQVFVSGK